MFASNGSSVEDKVDSHEYATTVERVEDVQRSLASADEGSSQHIHAKTLVLLTVWTTQSPSPLRMPEVIDF